MKHCSQASRAVLTLAAALVATLSMGADADLCLRVMSYNIHHGEGVDGRLDLERIAGVINAAGVDVVALQEVDDGAERTKRVDQPQELARLTGMQVVFGDNIPYQGGRYGNALLTRMPVESSANHPLPSHYEGEQRGVMDVTLKPPAGWPRVRMLATHFDYRAGSAERPASARLVNRLVTQEPGTPRDLTLLLGDLNARPGSPTLNELSKRWRSASASPAPTFPVDRPARQIDHVLLAKHSLWRVASFEVLEERVASDHRPIVATLCLEPDSPSTVHEGDPASTAP